MECLAPRRCCARLRGSRSLPIGKATSTRSLPGDQLAFICSRGSRRTAGSRRRQKNPHPKGTLAYAAWVIARLGAWDGYYGKPGPKVMRLGLQDFQLIKYGHQLGSKDV